MYLETFVFEEQKSGDLKINLTDLKIPLNKLNFLLISIICFCE